MKFFVLLVIKLYRSFVSPVFTYLFGCGCKYKVTCSQYAQEIIMKEGLIKGLPLAFRRFLSCNNFGFK